MGRTKKLLVLLLILALFMGLYVAISRWAVEEEEDSGIQSELISILSFEPEDVISLYWEYDGEDGRESYRLEKEDETWIWPEDKDLELDQEAIEQMLYNISSLSATSQIETEDDPDLEQYGLEEDPYSVIRLEFSEESEIPEITLLTGDYSSVAGQYYAKIDGQVGIYLVEGTYTESFQCTPEDLEYIEETSEEES